VFVNDLFYFVLKVNYYAVVMSQILAQQTRTHIWQMYEDVSLVTTSGVFCDV